MYHVTDDSAKCDRTLYQGRGLKPIGAMIHTTDGVSSQDWLQRGSRAAGKPASIDYLTTRSGDLIKCVPRGMMSYHAGRCWWGGALDNSDRASRDLIGIEVENADSKLEVPTPAQHMAVAGLLLRLADHFSWSPLVIYGHYGLAIPMGRRSDPHGWDWGYMYWLMAHAADLVRVDGDIVI